MNEHKGARSGAVLRRIALTALLVTLVSTLVATSSSATMPGSSEGKIAFVRHNQIYTMSKTGTNVTQLTTSGKNYRPRWSPNGKRISYIHEDSAGHKNAFVMSATGAGKSQVTTLGNVTTTPVWSPDGKTLAIGAGGQQDPCCTYPSAGLVYLVNSTSPFGTPASVMTTDEYGDVRQLRAYPGTELAWSPNGGDLSAVNDISADSPDTGLHVVHGMQGATEASARTAVYSESIPYETGGECCGEQLWSDLDYVPNGALGWAVEDLGSEFQWQNSPHYSLYYPGFVSQLGDKAGAPSPTGQHMVFVRVGSDGSTPNIWVSKLNGGSRVMILKNGYQPDWQPVP